MTRKRHSQPWNHRQGNPHGLLLLDRQESDYAGEHDLGRRQRRILDGHTDTQLPDRLLVTDKRITPELEEEANEYLYGRIGPLLRAMRVELEGGEWSEEDE